GLPYGLSEAVRLLQEVERPVLVVCGERFSDKIGTVRTSRMIFGDGAAALVFGPAPAGAPPDIEWFQTYASGPMSEADSIIWPNPELDNNITVYGPEVKALVKRYLLQMIAELQALPHPDGRGGTAVEEYRHLLAERAPPVDPDDDVPLVVRAFAEGARRAQGVVADEGAAPDGIRRDGPTEVPVRGRPRLGVPVDASGD